MFFLLSGEGVSDMGSGKGAGVNEGDDFSPGPMAIIVDQVVESNHGYSIFDVGCFGFVSEVDVASRAGELKAAKKKVRLPGKRRPRRPGISSTTPGSSPGSPVTTRRSARTTWLRSCFGIRTAPPRRGGGCGRTSGSR